MVQMAKQKKFTNSTIFKTSTSNPDKITRRQHFFTPAVGKLIRRAEVASIGSPLFERQQDLKINFYNAANDTEALKNQLFNNKDLIVKKCIETGKNCSNSTTWKLKDGQKEKTMLMKIESVQRRFTKAIPSIRHLPYLSRLNSVGLQTIVKIWNALPEEVVSSPSYAIFKTKLLTVDLRNFLQIK
ncbi:hypothetical protein HELRODRAFT_180339 [Helobdella robusta]|uniref:Uncharacterized protein n=1 Tax=Helobdella robusta TaxID=6412 RepID=T1FFS1_HELRO|nr:hypothetical protein HELRODRAFT_180339 [Helobdella robusta]ESN93932.1 hypothetical protein HELRODRAFT_180339 [Helobdella robusta]